MATEYLHAPVCPRCGADCRRIGALGQKAAARCLLCRAIWIYCEALAPVVDFVRV